MDPNEKNNENYTCGSSSDSEDIRYMDDHQTYGGFVNEED